MRKRPGAVKILQPSPEKMDERINGLQTAEECEIFSRNVIERGFPELAVRAGRRAVALLAAGHDAQDDTEREAFEAVYAYERFLSRNTGKRTRATGIWNMVKRVGVVEAVQRSVNRPAESGRYTMLKEIGLQDLAFESIVVKHPEKFAQNTVDRAAAYLAECVQA